MSKELYQCPHARNGWICNDCLHHHPHEEKFYNGLNICAEISYCVITMPKKCVCVPVTNKQQEITI